MIMDMSYIATLVNGYNVKVAKINARRMFSFSHYGSQEKALLAAREYRDSLYRDFDIQPIVPGAYRPRFRSRNENGAVSGIALEIDGNSVYFVVKFFEDGFHQRRRFSVRKLGYVPAFRAACKLRIEKACWNMSVEEFDIMRPTLEQYIKICKISKDIPAPHMP
jgi:hypothetical protein